MKKLFTMMLCGFLSLAVAFADGPFRIHRFDSFKVLAPAEGSILFLGNSITDMHCWPEVFKTSTGEYLPIVNRGVSGTYSTEQSDNLESYLLNKPKKVFMMIGTNDIATQGGLNFSPELVLSYVQSIVERIHLRYPDTKVYLYSILNNNTYNRVEATWLRTNEIVKEYADATDNVTYVDIYEALKGIASGGVWSYDKLHLTAEAYRVWSEAICEHLAEGEDYTVKSLYPADTANKQNDGGLTNAANRMRATYFSMLPVATDDILVFGDELVKNGEWQELLGNSNVKNRGTNWGYGGDIATTGKLFDATFADTGVEKKAPKALFLYTGTSDADGNTSIESVKSSYTTLVDKIKAKLPSTKIYLMALVPTNDATKNSNRISVLNTHIESLAGGNVKFVDTYNPLLTGNVANSKYVNSNKYLLGLGYIKFAQKMKDVLSADFSQDNYTVLDDAAGEVRYSQAGLRNSISQAIGTCLRVEIGESVGAYSAATMELVKSEVAKANALLSSDNLSEQQVQEQVANLKKVLTEGINMPLPSNDNEEHWYQIVSLRSGDRYISATGAAGGVVGSLTDAKYAKSMWKFVDRGNGTYDIVNREHKTYLNPVATYNTQIYTVAAKPATGWTIDFSNTTGYFIISSGEVQLNQTGNDQSYKLYNWSNQSNKGNDKSDDGCQLRIMEAVEPEELPAEGTSIVYTLDNTTGNLYHKDGAANQSWNASWKSNATPELVFGCGGINNMNWVGNNIQLMTGTVQSATYSINAPTGYVIEEYSFTFKNNSNHSTALSLTMDNGASYSTSAEEQVISEKNLDRSSVTFVLAGENGNGVVLTNFTVKVKSSNASLSLPEISSDGDVHWYYITSASSHAYCAGKVMYYDADIDKMRFGDKTFTADRIWSFWQKDGKLTIKNYAGKYMGKAGNGTGNSTQFGAQDTPNYIYNIQDSHGFYIIKDDAVELHAQNDNTVIVRWQADANGASLWRFDKVDTSNAKAEFSNTNVVQGKVTTGIGNKNQPIIRSTIRIAGLDGSCNLQCVKGAFVGTASDDVENVKAYISSNARELFVDEDKEMEWRDENGVLFGQPVDIAADGTFTITGDAKLATGNNYLWIAYDIADDAVEGHLVDAKITSYTIDGKEVAEKNGDPAHSVTIFLSEGAVLMPMDNGSLYYRIPSITVTRDGKRLVTLTDDRKGHNGDLPSHCYLVAQYSEDNGRTWSEPQTVAGTETTGGNYGHGDASIVTNRDNGDIIGIMTSAGTYGHGFYASTSEQPQRWKTIVSHDGGLTWEAPVDHTDDLYGAKSPNKHWEGGFSGSGAALQKRDGTLVSSFVNRESDGSKNFYFFMSDDGGENWYVSGTSGTKNADEPKTLERNNGDLAISVRASGFNYYNYTSNDGKTWHKPSQTRFTTGISGNACDGEYMVWCSTLEGNPWNIALQTMPHNPSRQNVSIALSTDEGATFGTPKTICPIGSAYSAAVVLPDGTLGVYYEESGVYGSYTMRFVRFSLDWASDGKYKFTESAPFYPIKSTNTTSVEVVENESGDDAVYNMLGQKVSDITSPGIYIKNGVKFMVK
ncbi:MAG: exo-alpha-sialidase [Bacteroidaceae bacterium]|nr:exo-alpha-sialidase [Bacteroidaceae bacterium]